MRPSSSPSEGLFSAVLARGPVAAECTDDAWLRALLDVEAALARAVASVGLVPEEVARGVTAACADASAYDVHELGRSAAAGGNPVIPLVRAIERRAGDAGWAVHYGATSQDVVDTAMVLVAERAVRALLEELAAVVAAAAGLGQRYRDTVMIGRTLLQQAVPTTFGLKAVGWAVALHGGRERLASLALPVQLGGAAGTLASYGGRGRDVSLALATELGLRPAVLPWHTARLPVADLAGALGATAGVVGKVALDVVLLAQSEVGEVGEGGADRGGSSAMPHKRNPVAAVSARAAARRAPGLVATLLACMEQEHERAAGAWHAEWAPMSDLLVSVGSATAWLRECLTSVVIDPDRMRLNVETAREAFGAETLAAALAPSLGRARAHDVVSAAARTAQQEGGRVRDVLERDPRIREALMTGEVNVPPDKATSVGEASALVDAALAAIDAARSGS
ncbi:MAG: 3-carboxy-cis,cis-muconate cycloisomerase [Actinomycetota bacterium]|nr:3-carboxy-cis,cis-muconate cycloisomerase [Actinomycetota bacterium]